MKDFMNYDFNIEKIVLACFVPAGTGQVVHKNRPSHGLAINKSGEKIYTFSDGKRLSVKENDIVFLPKNSTYTVSSIVIGDCYAINFDIPESVAFSPFVVKAKSHSIITEHFRTANKVWGQKKSGYMIKCKADLYNIIYKMQQEYSTEYLPNSKLDIIRPALDYIHQKYTTELISIDTLSGMCSITPEYLRKIFKSFYGISPINYINNLKLARAAELLESQMYSVSEAATLSGFSDASHFSREFKRLTGISPSKYKKSVQ